MSQHPREPANTAGEMMAQWKKTLPGKHEDWSSRPRTHTKHFNPALRRQRWKSPSELASFCELLFQWETASVNRVATKEDITYQLLASCTHPCVHTCTPIRITWADTHTHTYMFKKLKGLQIPVGKSLELNRLGRPRI